MPNDTFKFFAAFAAAHAHGVHNLLGNQIVVALTNAEPDTLLDAVLADITQIDYTNLLNNPTSRNITVTSSSQTGGVYKAVWEDKVLEASGGSVGPFQWAVFYNDSASGDPLIGRLAYPQATIMNDTETFSLNINETTGIFQITYNIA
jgi:hypothetical protein